MSDAWGEPRSKTVTWYDPVASAERGLALPGIDHLRGDRGTARCRRRRSPG